MKRFVAHADARGGEILYIKNINNTRRERERNWIMVGYGARRKMREELFFVIM